MQALHELSKHCKDVRECALCTGMVMGRSGKEMVWPLHEYSDESVWNVQEDERGTLIAVRTWGLHGLEDDRRGEPWIGTARKWPESCSACIVSRSRYAVGRLWPQPQLHSRFTRTYATICGLYVATVPCLVRRQYSKVSATVWNTQVSKCSFWSYDKTYHPFHN